jgi:sulfite reductase (NADPH) flavoprotein alpha-component
MNFPVDPLRWWTALALLITYGLMCASIWWAHRRGERERLFQQNQLGEATAGEVRVLVAHGSQTGQAEQLAWRTAESLHLAGRGVRVCALNEVDATALAQVSELYVITSTYGEGDPPDSAALFADHLGAPDATSLSGLKHAVLALGDREYEHFCGFGRRVDGWLVQQGATPMFERIEVNQMDEVAVRAWFEHLSRHAGAAAMDGWQAEQLDVAGWRLADRRLLNAGSPGEGVYHLELEPVEGPLPDWAAGDLVHIAPPEGAVNEAGEPDRQPRAYSIASVPEDGRLHLLVRLRRLADGGTGCVSGWLCLHASIGERLTLGVRPHPAFRIGDNINRRLLLVGNGTGMAGLRAHLRARARLQSASPPAGQGDGPAAAPSWLFFGERDPKIDLHHREELQAWQAAGLLAGLDLAFSRDPVEPAYVQQSLAARAHDIREWVNRGAAIYVCGSLAGMAAAVDETLREVLGGETLLTLQREGHYRRDVY